jgi:pSer/pThr/pTyr-binding forkhead associated (FHA) protein
MAHPAPVPSPAAAPGQRNSVPGGALHRPPAPEVSFAPRGEPQPTVPLPMSPCPLCGSSNQRGLRFCVTCGHLLAGAAAPAPMPVPRGGTTDLSHTVPEAPPRFSSAPPPPTPTPPPIAPVRVVELGTSPAPAMQRLCSRCRGASEQTAQFCRFCGASLADAQSVPIQPSANPIAATPGPPAAAPAPVAARAPVAPTAPPSPAPTAAPAPPPAPAPAPHVVAGATRARVVLIARDGNEGPSYPLGESTDIGRTEGNIVIAEDRYISPRHARVAMRGGAFFVRDLESTNGVFVRIPFPRGGSHDGAGEGLKPADAEQVLADQDLFLVGQQVLRFEVVKHADEGFGVASENGTLLFGTPAAPRYARLSQRTVEGVVRDVFHVKKAETVIGRESGDIVFSDDAFLSRRHAVVRVHGVTSVGGPRSFTLGDLGSSNGTFLQVREEVRLRHGDHFRIGQQLFRFDT